MTRHPSRPSAQPARRPLVVAAVCLVVLASALRAATPQVAVPAPDPLVGTWQGTLAFGGQELELAFRIERDGKAWRAEFDSITQGARGIPVTRVAYEGTRVVLAIDALRARFEGALQPAADGAADGGGPDRRLVGTWHQGGAELPLTLEPVDAVREPARPQHPKPPFPYRVEEVAFGHDPAQDLASSFRAGGGSPVTLAGTLTLPAGDGPFPAAVMITGSGPQDRDETLLGHKPFLVLADALTRAGLAVLRYDDRGFGASTGDFRTATTADFADDARAAMRYLASRADIDSTRIGLIGHSEGGLVAPLVAAGPDADRVAFAVLIAPPAVNIRDVILLQSRRIAAAGGAPAGALEVQEALTTAAFEALVAMGPAADGSRADRAATVQAAVEEAWEALPEAQRLAAAGALEAAMRGLRGLDTPWMRWLVRHDPTVPLRAMRCDVLAMFGAKDLQVIPAQNVGPLQDAFAAGGHVQPTVVVLEDHNHLFQRAETGAPSEYGRIEETFSPQALEVLRGWLATHVLGR